MKNLTAVELGKKIKSKEISVAEAVDFALDASEKNTHNAFISFESREKLSARVAEIQAKIDADELTSPLAGVPVGVKDNICTSGLRTTCGSKILGDFAPPYNATAFERLENAGAIVIGKTNMDEFGMGSTSETSFFGAVKNPWDLSRVTGGSSGGSAAAVAAGEVFYALGSDTGGSIRQPASYCGVTGFKPTYGTVSRYGLIAYASSLEQIGPVCRDAVDCAAVYKIIAGKDPLDGTSIDLPKNNHMHDIAGKKIALPDECFGDGVDDDVKSRVLAAAEVFRTMGAQVERISLPFYDYVIPAYYIIATAEASSNLSRFDGIKYGFRADADNIAETYKTTRSEGFGAETIKRILLGTFVLSSGFYDAYYRKALQVKAMIRKDFNDVFYKYDAIICPTAPATAPRLGESMTDTMKMYLSDIFTVAANLAGLPAISVPCGFDAEKMPVGAQIIGNRTMDNLVLDLGKTFQSATNFHKETPKGGAK